MSMLDLSSIPTSAPGHLSKSETKALLTAIKNELFHLQNQLYAQKKRSLLIVFQGVDTAGKDSTIRKVFSGMNPTGVKVKSFKKPTEEENNHDFMWRIFPHFPEKGFVQIFNRSHYEDIIMPQILGETVDLAKRLQFINATEDHLRRNGTEILKFFLHVSKDEQAIRIMDRKMNPKKSYKYTLEDDLAAKKYSTYQKLYNRLLNTPTNIPWKVIPADKKWHRNHLVALAVKQALEQLTL